MLLTGVSSLSSTGTRDIIFTEVQLYGEVPKKDDHRYSLILLRCICHPHTLSPSPCIQLPLTRSSAEQSEATGVHNHHCIWLQRPTPLLESQSLDSNLFSQLYCAQFCVGCSRWAMLQWDLTLVN